MSIRDAVPVSATLCGEARVHVHVRRCGLMRCLEGCAQDAGGDDEGNSKSKEKRRRKKEKERQEQMVKEKEAKLLDAKHAPETAEEFERLVMSSPNSSFIWIKYMAFHLELTEIDKAREVRSSLIIVALMPPACAISFVCALVCDLTAFCVFACMLACTSETDSRCRGGEQVSERALKTINFREEQEKLNVWVARLNLENLYGSRETLMNKFEEACKLNDAKKMHMQLLAIFEKNGEAQVTEHFFKTLTRKFRSSCKVLVSPRFSLPLHTPFLPASLAQVLACRLLFLYPIV